jgi:hypothetical protein
MTSISTTAEPQALASALDHEQEERKRIRLRTYQVDLETAGFFLAAGTSGDVLRRLADLSSVTEADVSCASCIFCT